jgi:hypothetical protein
MRSDGIFVTSGTDLVLLAEQPYETEDVLRGRSPSTQR